MATKDNFIKGQEQGKEWEKRTTKAKVKGGQQRLKESHWPLTQSPFCFFLPLLHPNTPKMSIYTLKQVISIRNISVTQSKLASSNYNSDTLSPLSTQIPLLSNLYLTPKM